MRTREELKGKVKVFQIEKDTLKPDKESLYRYINGEIGYCEFYTCPKEWSELEAIKAIMDSEGEFEDEEEEKWINSELEKRMEGENYIFYDRLTY